MIANAQPGRAGLDEAGRVTLRTEFRGAGHRLEDTMITGHVNEFGEAVVTVTVVGSSSQREIEAVIDTGFNGSLTLPPSLVEDLELPFRRRDRAVLGDGSETFFDTHEEK